MSVIYLGNLDPDATVRDLHKELDRYGKIKDIWIARNPPGFAFVEFDEAYQAKEAVREVDGRSILTTKVRVEVRKRAGARSGKLHERVGGRDSGRDHGPVSWFTFLGLSLIINACVAGNSEPVANHEDVLAACATRVEALVRHVVSKAVMGCSYLAALPSFIYVPSTYTTPAPSRGASGRARHAAESHAPAQQERKAFDPDAEDEFNNAIVSVLALGAIVAGLFIVLRDYTAFYGV